MLSMGENNKKLHFSSLFSSKKSSNRLIIWGNLSRLAGIKNVPPEFVLTDYTKFFIPPRREKNQLSCSFQKFHKKRGWQKVSKNVLTWNKLLLSLNLQQVGLAMSFMKNKKVLMCFHLSLSLKKVILYWEFQ